MDYYILISSTKEYKINPNIINFISKIIENITDKKIIPKQLSPQRAFEWKIVTPEINKNLISLIKDFLVNKNIDFNLTSTVRERKKKLLLADMDSTIIKEESLDELAKLIGLEKEVSIITEKAMNGEIDFQEALIKRVSMLKNQPTEILNNLKNNININIGAKELIKTMNSNGAQTVLVSGGFTFLTEYLKTILDFSFAHANTLQISKSKNGIEVLTGRVELPILDKKAKLQILKQYTKKLNLNLEETICVGDGANDIEMIQNAGLGVSYNGKDILDKTADLIFRHTNLKGLLYAQGYTDKEIVS
jgi:phosphoserine phosphatase|tara:strand:- start:945 stop:1859 length:915 start_codon:yes stop_codon:yes gene_type:complete